MFVRDCMSSPAVTITPDTPFQVALKAMHDHKFRRLPVVDKNGRLAGIVSERDLLHASPSPASSLSVWEMNYLLAKLTVQQIMTRAIIITSPDTPIEHAASLMVANKIGGLPVVDENDRVVGMITETDIFKVFVEMMDGKEGVRLTVDLPDNEDLSFDFIEAIHRRGGHLTAMGTVAHNAGKRRVVVVVRGLAREMLDEPLQLLGSSLVDAFELSVPVGIALPPVAKNGKVKLPAR
ncbi:MAG: CBS domain-containing protein [Caldilineaceae bacterium]|nr:CBS domain-containing protein [Caldilineaceae bacterium]